MPKKLRGDQMNAEIINKQLEITRVNNRIKKCCDRRNVKCLHCIKYPCNLINEVHILYSNLEFLERINEEFLSKYKK